MATLDACRCVAASELLKLVLIVLVRICTYILPYKDSYRLSHNRYCYAVYYTLLGMLWFRWS